MYSKITTDELADVLETGFCWNPTGNPTIEDSHTIYPQPAIKEINETVANLLPATTYYLRASARNDHKQKYS